MFIYDLIVLILRRGLVVGCVPKSHTGTVCRTRNFSRKDQRQSLNKRPLTLEEIGENFDLTRERVRQIKEKAIRRLKHTSRNKILMTYLG